MAGISFSLHLICAFTQLTTSVAQCGEATREHVSITRQTSFLFWWHTTRIHSLDIVLLLRVSGAVLLCLKFNQTEKTSTNCIVCVESWRSYRRRSQTLNLIIKNQRGDSGCVLEGRDAPELVAASGVHQ